MRLAHLFGLKKTEPTTELPQAVKENAQALVAQTDAEIAEMKAKAIAQDIEAVALQQEAGPIAAELAAVFPERTWTVTGYGVITSEDEPQVTVSRPVESVASWHVVRVHHWRASCGHFAERGQTAVIAVRDVLRAVAVNEAAALTDANLAAFRAEWPSWEFTRHSGKCYSGRPAGDDNTFHAGHIRLSDDGWGAFHAWPLGPVGKSPNAVDAMRIVVEKERA